MIMGEPQVSILIPCRRGGQSLIDCLSSVWAAVIEESLHAEILALDNGGNEDVLARVNELFPQATVLSCSEVRGAAYARNCGFQAARSASIICLDVDIQMQSGCLSLLLASLEGADIVFPTILTPDGKVLHPTSPFTRRYCLNSAVFAIRRDALEKLDRWFDERIEIYGEDNDFFLRAQRCGLRFHYVGTAVAFHPIAPVLGERHYYLTVRNAIYVWLKLRGLINYWMPMDLWILAFLFSQFLSALLNHPLQAIDRSVKVTEGPRLRLIRLFAKAITWNIRNIQATRLSRQQYCQSIAARSKAAGCES